MVGAATQVILLASVIAAGPGRAEELRAGAARVDITPPIGFPMWGYSARHDAPCLGVLDALQARALVLAAGKERIAIVSLDLGRAPTRQSFTAMRKEIMKTAGIEHLFLVASHTHHGPVIELDDWPTLQTSYVRQLEKKIAGLVASAARQLRPARIGIAGKEVDLNRNRQSRLADAPVDRALTVVRVEGIDGKAIAHLVNFAAHPILQDVKVLKFSADYPGVLARLVEAQTDAPCLFLQGAAGDLSPSPGLDRSPDAFGQRSGNEALALARIARCTITTGPLGASEEDFRFGKRVDLSNPFVRAGFSAAFFPALVDFYEREYRDGVRPHMTVAVLAGRVGIVGVSGEFFCGHALNLKKRARLDYLLFLGYCNDYQQYFPTIEAVAEGGYGADPPVAPAAIGAGEHMMNRALMSLYALRKQDHGIHGN